ncbi:hypothetical protein AcW1_001721 [Taiwanofungus camphoratus]|nr:hypothetical protein AcV5_000223 [Antrodia cinnamomea]KAI0944895.1 hypothetical protein AcV7_001576 [Antrodia cinnamomea]KAI0945514.1 hypothetical protein AcW1_001721 [Antrodia cinnamomea]
MQQPTLQNIRIRSTRDACQIFYAVTRNVLPMTTRRLDAEERRAITSGNVYIWEERCANSEATGMGMERWTDGMGWGPSRVRDEFLFYHQRESEVNDDPSHPSARWANMMRRREPRPGSLPFSRSDSERLIKQTYSVHVSLPEDRPRNVTRKWHLTAYFSQTTLDSLGTIDDIPGVGDVRVPDGWFKSARASKAKRTDSGDELPASQDPWGLGLQNSSSQGLSHFPVDPESAQDIQLLASSSYISHPSHAGPSSYSYSPHPAHHLASPVRPVAADPTMAMRAPHEGAGAAPFPPRLPTLYDSGLHTYRDPSPFNLSSSSSSSDPGPSPRPFSSPLTPPASVVLPAIPSPVSSIPSQAALGSRDLVPLSYLQGISGPVRDPVDELFLRRFSTSGIASPTVPPAWVGTRPDMAGRGAFESDDTKPSLPLRAW